MIIRHEKQTTTICRMVDPEELLRDMDEIVRTEWF